MHVTEYNKKYDTIAQLWQIHSMTKLHVDDFQISLELLIKITD